MGEATYRSALVVLPPSSRWQQFNDIRKKHDKAYPRWMPHINLIYPYKPDNAFPAEQPHLAKCLANFEPFEVTFNQDSFGYFSHGKNCTVYLKPLCQESIEDEDVAEVAEFTEEPVMPEAKQKTTKKVERMVKKRIPVDNFEETSSESVVNNSHSINSWNNGILGFVDPNPGRFPVSSSLDALRDAQWNLTSDNQDVPRVETCGIDQLKYAVWQHKGIAKTSQVANNMETRTNLKDSTGNEPNVIGLKYKEVWKDMEEETETETDNKSGGMNSLDNEILGFVDPNPGRFPVSSSLDALRDAQWNLTSDNQDVPRVETCGIDQLKFTIWKHEDVAKTSQVANNMETRTNLKGSTQNEPNVIGLKYKEVWEEAEEETEIETDDGNGFVEVPSKFRNTETEIYSNIATGSFKENESYKHPILELQNTLQSVYPHLREQSTKSPPGFQPHLTLGQCKSWQVHQFIENLKKDWKEITFEVKAVHMISRKSDNDPFEIKRAIPFGIFANDV